MTMEVQFKDAVREIPEKQVDAPAVAKQNHDFPQNSGTEANTSSVPDKGMATAPHEGQSESDSVKTESPNEVDVLALKRPDIPEELAEWSAPFDIESVANEMRSTIARHCLLSDEQVTAIVLWIFSSYLINAFWIFPNLFARSPEMRCGKSTMMRVISSICRNGLHASNISPAVLFRLTDHFDITLLIDEADTFVANASQDLVGIINSGHNRSTAVIIRCDGDEHRPRAFNTYFPKALAAIGSLPPTIEDRSIIINLNRMKPTESVERIPGNFYEQLQPVRRKILTWCKASIEAIRKQPTEPPNIGNDRAVDNWLPLFTVAEHISGEWPELCFKAYQALTTVAEPELPTQLLKDIRQLFQNNKDSRISSADLIMELCKDDTGPWQTSNNGRQLSPHQLAKLLSPYGIKPDALRFGDKVKRGYEQSQFIDAFERYLP